MALTDQQVKQYLDDMAEIDLQLAELDFEKQKRIDEIYTQEIRDKIAEINAEFGPMVETANKNRAEKDAAIRQEILETPRHIAGTVFEVKYNKGKWSWLMKKVEEYFKDKPEDLAALREQGKPYTTISKIPEKKEEKK